MISKIDVWVQAWEVWMRELEQVPVPAM